MLLLLSVLCVVLLVGCSQAEEPSLDGLESEMEGLSDEQLDAVVEAGESEDSAALAGQASALGKINYKRAFAASKVRVDRLQAKSNIEAVASPEWDFSKGFDVECPGNGGDPIVTPRDGPVPDRGGEGGIPQGPGGQPGVDPLADDGKCAYYPCPAGCGGENNPCGECVSC